MNHQVGPLSFADLEALMDSMPKLPPDPFALRFPFGINVIESPDVPVYELPAEVIPGVPWPPGFRDEINRWALGFFGTRNIVPKGTVYMIAGRYAVMRHDQVGVPINCV